MTARAASRSGSGRRSPAGSRSEPPARGPHPAAIGVAARQRPGHGTAVVAVAVAALCGGASLVEAGERRTAGCLECESSFGGESVLLQLSPGVGTALLDAGAAELPNMAGHVPLSPGGVAAPAASSVPAVAHVASAAAGATQPAAGGATRTNAEQAAAREVATAERAGIKLNKTSDSESLICSLILSIALLVVAPVTFAALRRHYPLIYCNNKLEGVVQEPDDGIFGWARASLSATTEQIAESAGLDQAMYVEYLNLCIKIMAVLTAVMLLVVAPLGTTYSDGGRQIGSDIAATPQTFRGPVLWAYALGIWVVALTAQRSIFAAQEAFLHLRFRWLLELPKVRANTVLVEGIPEEFRSDERLFRFFEDMVTGEGNVERAYIVRDTSELAPVVERLETAKKQLREAQLIREKYGEVRREDATDRLPRFGSFWSTKWLYSRKSVEYYEAEVSALQSQVETLRASLQAAVKEGPTGGALLSTGFVTFFQRAEAEVARRLEVISRDADEWVVSTPPCPSDVQWSDFTQDPRLEMWRHFAGYALAAGLYAAYMPIVLGASRLAQLVDLGPLQPMWRSYAPTFCLQFMVALLPCFLLMIFKACFKLRAAAWAQHNLQQSYFWFLLVYVVLGVVVGHDVGGFLGALIDEPPVVLVKLERGLPSCTNFFMNYCMVDLYMNCVTLMRPSTLGSYLLLRGIYAEEEARQMAEPEDQSSHGLGARSARASIMLAIGLIYGGVGPLVCACACADFLVTRVAHGYLLLYAETRKADLGGAFWVTQVRHAFVALLLFASWMTAFVARSGELAGPVVVAASSVAFLAWAWHRFETGFRWEKLPMKDLLQDTDAAFESQLIFKSYCQPELPDQDVYATHASEGRRRASDVVRRRFSRIETSK